LGVRLTHFEVFFHRVTSWIEVEGLVEIATVDETTKNAFCQEKMGVKESLFIGRFWPWVMKQYGLKDTSSSYRELKMSADTLSAPP